MEYVPRAPTSRVSHPYDVYLKKCAEGRKRGRIRYRDLPIIDRSEISITKELMLKDHVITQLNARVFKLEAIIQVLGHDKFGGVLEKLEFNDVFRNLSAEFCDELNNDFLELFASTKDTETDDDVEYILEDELRLRLDEEERWRLEEERINEEENRMRLEEEKQFRAKQEKMLMLQADKKKKSKEFMNSEHMKIYRNRLAPAKWTHGSGEVSAYYWSKKYLQSEKKTPFGIVDPDMTDLLRDVEPWIEDTRARFNVSSHGVKMFGLTAGSGKVLPSNANWAMVSSYFVQLLLQDSMPLWYADGKTYNIPWSGVEKVIIPINEPKKHWLVAQFDIRTGVVTFYDIGLTFKEEWRDWYVSLRKCLKVIVNDMSDNIPFELQVDIMNRLPVKALLQFRTVSKSWKYCIDSPDFGVGYDARGSHTTPFTLTYDQGTSQGVWCFHSFYKIAVIWNPSLKKSVGLTVPTLLSHRAGHKSFIAFGVSPHNMDPTVLHISLPTKGHGRWFVSWFSFNTKQWNPIDPEKLPRESIRLKRSSQAVIGRYIFWVASEKHVQNESTGYCYKSFLIMSFDLLSMTFQEVEIPESIRVHLPIPFSIFAHGDALVVCGNILADVNNVFCVRILEVEGASLTGRILRSFTHQSHCCLRLLGFTKYEEPIVEVDTPFQSEHTLEVYQQWSGQFHNVCIEGDAGTFFMGPYMESLILLNELDGSVQLPIVLKKTNVFHTKGLDHKRYTISFKNAERVPKQRGIFGDCGIWACIFLYRLSHGISLDVGDPIQAALSYREQMARFYFKHKVSIW
ncbi:F-box domain-containing protein [Artemisia annua]|uniref:F-box domain-containing protein n=1 Tax=Artemisia annua TaxID=35608 RepID=A0A2U1KZL8_ARTAN|nr:F-box domain-containing protein [Artemisia annua]